MKHISLFSGIGGFDLASEWMGWDNIASCEIADFPNKILEYYWPNATHHRNIYDTDFTIYRGQCDILTGGFPCQPFSVAGKRKGTEDSRHLWPEMLRAIRQIQPTWIVGENVFGLINWDGGLVFEQVQVDLENEGYQVQAYGIPAASVDAPHRRDRVWIVAYSNHGNDRRASGQNERSSKEERLQERDKVWESCKSSDLREFSADTNSIGYNRRYCKRCSICEWKVFSGESKKGEVGCKIEGCCRKRNVANTNSGGRVQNNKEQPSRQFKQDIPSFEGFPTQAPICNGDDGLSSRLDSITFPKWRSESIKGGGNAIVPQVAFEIFKAIEKYNSL